MTEGVPFDPDWVVNPGEVLAEWMKENNTSLEVTAARGQLTAIELQGVIEGDIPIDEAVATKLEFITLIPCSLWLNLERAFRAGLAAGKLWTR